MKPIKLSIFFFFIVTCLTLNSMAFHDIESDAMRIIQESGKVQVIRPDGDIEVTKYGVRLEDGDEILTNPEGKAHILLSMLSDNDEVYVAPSSRIRVSSRVSDSLTSIFHIHVIYGKIRVNSMLNQAKQVRFDSDLVEVTVDEGEFILESRKFGTSVGTVEGLVKMVYKATGKEYQIPQKLMMFISPLKSVSPTKVFVNELFAGVEKTDKEKAEEKY